MARGLSFPGIPTKTSLSEVFASSPAQWGQKQLIFSISTGWGVPLPVGSFGGSVGGRGHRLCPPLAEGLIFILWIWSTCPTQLAMCYPGFKSTCEGAAFVQPSTSSRNVGFGGEALWCMGKADLFFNAKIGSPFLWGPGGCNFQQAEYSIMQLN